jgi:hypothetical protein
MKIMKRTHSLRALLAPVPALAFCSNLAQAQPAINIQPTDQAVLLGAAASFSVKATGALPISYQWQLGGSNISSNTSSLAIPVVHNADVGAYAVIVSDATGSITSSVARLTLLGPPPIITLLTNTPDYNVVAVQYTVAPHVNFQLLLAHDMSSPVIWYGPVMISNSGDATNYNWSYNKATNYTEYYPQTYWQLDPYP